MTSYLRAEDVQAAKADEWLNTAKARTQAWLTSFTGAATPMPDQNAPQVEQTPAMPQIKLPSAEELRALAPWRDLDPLPQQQPQQQAPAAASGAPMAMPTGGEQTATQAPRPMAAASSGGNHGEIDNSSREAFVRTAYPYMLEAAGGDQNLAELMLAKAISENGSIGTGRPFWANNFSGIKGEGDAGSVEADTWEDYGNGPVNIRDRFAAYSTPQAGMAAFMQFLRDNSRYHPALARYEQTRDASQLFRDIRAAGYATDPIWAEKVENIRATQVAPVVRGQSGQDMPRLSLNAAQPLAPGGSAAPPAPGGVSSAPPGAPPAPWEMPGAQDGGQMLLKENDETAPPSVPFLPGDGGYAPQPEYDPRDADQGLHESRPAPIMPTDPTVSDPAYTQNPNAAPMVDPLDPSTITPAALPPLSNGPRMMQPQPQYRDPREGQGIIARGIDAIGQYLPSAPIVDTKPGDAEAFMGAMPNTPGKLWEWRGRVAEGAADALSRGTGMDPDALVLNVEVGGIPIQMTVSELLENVTDPLLAAGWGVGDMVLDAAGRAVLRLVAPYAKGAARETIGRLLNSEPVQRGVEAVREGADALGRGLGNVGREVAGQLMDLNPAMTPRIIGDGPGIGRSMPGPDDVPTPSSLTPPAGGRPQQRTVEWLAEQIDYTKRVLDDLDPSTEGELIGQVQDRLGRLQGEWVDAVNARRALEPRIRSEVGRRVNELPIDERTASDYAGIGRERVAPEAGIPTTRDDTPRSPGLNSAPAYNGRGVGIGAQAAADVGASLQGGVVGAAAGYGMPADSEEERRRNALIFGAAGMVGMPIAGRAVGRGMRGAGRGTRLGIIPPHVADQMGDTFPVRIPQDPKTIRAIESIGGTVDPQRGVTINVTRAQGPQAAGMPATRGGVFYEAVPEGGRSNFVRGSDDPTGVGGSQVIPSRPTTFRSPLIVSDAPGGTRGFDEAIAQLALSNPEAQMAQRAVAEAKTAQQAAYDTRFEAMQRWAAATGGDATDMPAFSRTPEGARVMEQVRSARAAVAEAEANLRAVAGEVPSTPLVNRDIQRARIAGPEGSEARAQALKEVVRKYGGDPELIDPLLRVRGADASESEWAIRENILAAHARRNGYDGVVTVQTDGGASAAEIMAHPKVVAAKKALDEANAIESAEIAKWRAGDYAIPESVLDATAKAEKAFEKAKQEAFDELSNRAKITELIDVREGANPTPGRLNPLLEERERAIARIEEITRDVMANPSRSPEESAALVQEVTALRQRLKEIEPELPAAEANRYTGDPGFSVRSDIPRPPGAQWAGLPFDPTSAAMGGAAGAMSEGEDGESGDPLRTAAGVFVAGLGNSRYGRRFIANAARKAQPGPPPNLWEIMQGFRFSWGMLGNLAQTGVVNAVGGPIELALGLPTEAVRMSLLRGRPIGTAHYAAETLSGLKDGARGLLATALGEIPPSVRNAPDFRPPMSERLAGRMGQVGNVDTGAVVGEAIDLPGRLSSQAPDSLWRPLFLRAGAAQERNTIMAENGISKLDPAAQWRELQRLKNNPTSAEAQRIAEASRKYADEMGYKGDPGYLEEKLANLMRGGRIATSKDPLIAQIHEAGGSFVMPFLGAVYKLHKLAATRVPGLGFAANSKLPMDQKLARQAVGAATIYLLADYAAQGMITGPGPSDPDEAAIVNKKMPPHSTYIPGVGWTPNDSLGSAGPYLNAIGGYYDARRYATEKDKAVAGKGDESVVKYVLRGFERFPVVQAAQSVIAMAESPIKGVSDFAANAASSFAPALYRTYQASQDQYARTVDREAGMDKGIAPALAEQTRQKIVQRVGYAPGLGAREDLQPALDRFGRPVENERQGAAAFLPRVSNPKPDALTEVFARAGIEPGMPPAEIDNIPLTTEQKREWLRVRGEWLASKQELLERNADAPEARRKNVFEAQMENAADRARVAVRRMFTAEQKANARKKAS